MPNIVPRLLAATLALLAGVSAEAAAAAEVAPVANSQFAVCFWSPPGPGE